MSCLMLNNQLLMFFFNFWEDFSHVFGKISTLIVTGPTPVIMIWTIFESGLPEDGYAVLILNYCSLLVNGKIISITYSATSSLSIQFSDLLDIWFFLRNIEKLFYVHSLVKIIFTPPTLWTQPTSRDNDLNKKIKKKNTTWGWFYKSFN